MLSNPLGEPYYVVAYARSLDAASVNFTVSATAVTLALGSVSPATVGDGAVTLEVQGGQLTANDTYQLLGPGGTVYTASQVYVTDSTTAYPTFDLTGAVTGDV